MRVLLVEDNPHLSSAVKQKLVSDGFSVDEFGLVEDASAAMLTVQYDLALLDLGLPDGEGIDLLHEWRKKGLKVPVIILTARDSVTDRVTGLDSGCDDYLIKPFNLDEMCARVRALLRRPCVTLSSVLTVGNTNLDTVAKQVCVGEDMLTITRRELDLLEHLMRCKGRIVSLAELEESLYGFDDDISSNPVVVSVFRLRKRLLNAGSNAIIKHLRGLGYLIIEKGHE